MRNTKVKLIDSHNDNLFYMYSYFITISLNVDSKHMKVDKNQQIENLEGEKTPHMVLHVSHKGTLPSSTLFFQSASHILPVL